MGPEHDRQAQVEYERAMKSDVILLWFNLPYVLYVDTRYGSDVDQFAQVLPLTDIFNNEWMVGYSKGVADGIATSGHALRHAMDSSIAKAVIQHMERKRPSVGVTQHWQSSEIILSLKKFKQGPLNDGITRALAQKSDIVLAQYHAAVARLRSIEDRKELEQLHQGRLYTETKEYKEFAFNTYHGYHGDTIKPNLTKSGVPDFIDPNPMRQTTADGQRVLFIEGTQLLWPSPKLD